MREPVAPPEHLPDTRVVLDSSACRVTIFAVGWITVRPGHREWSRPWSLRLAAVVASRRWVEWMPVNVVVMEHSRGVVLVDTGEAVDQPPGHFGCGSSAQEAFYRHCLRIPVKKGQDAPSRLRRAGIDPGSVDTLVLTHLHSDHVGNAVAFPRARVLVGEHAGLGVGAVACRLQGLRVGSPRLSDEPVGPFRRSAALTDDGVVRAVPLPGHTPGHLGVVVTVGTTLTVAAGDAAFDHDQLRRGASSAVVHDRADNRATQRGLCEVLDDGGTVALSHDASLLSP